MIRGDGGLREEPSVMGKDRGLKEELSVIGEDDEL